jgi:hypothetical protein
VEIQIESHTLQRAGERGVTRDQIIDVIRTGRPCPCGPKRLARMKIYGYHGVWNGRFYDQQMVKVIYVVEKNVAITGDRYYGRWQESP